MTQLRTTNGASRRGRIVATGAAVLLGLLAACDPGELLEVETPSRIPAAQFETPGNAALLVNGAIGDFECAYGSYVVAGGLIGEELVDGIQTADRYPFDRRSTQPNDLRYSTFGCTALGVYSPLQTARVQAENVRALLESWTDAEVPNRAQHIATMNAYAGYSLVLLGEGFCSMVVSGIDENRQVVLGGVITRDSVFKLAEARFTEALASTDPSVRNMALLGRAKARQNLGRLADARADAVQVPANFERVVTASLSAARRENRVWNQSSSTSRSALIGEPYRSMNDPRVPFVRTTQNTVTGVPVIYQTKYPAATTPIPFATGDEAQLIVAEADLAAGNLQAAVNIINTFRQRAGQTQFSSSNAAEIRAELIEQRRRELFLEGQHLGDLIRYNITPQPAAGTPYHGSGTYGNQICMPLPDVEKINNPNATG